MRKSTRLNRRKVNKALSPIAHNRQERLLLNLYRGLETKHERRAVIVLMASIAWGRLNKKADKVSVRGLFGVL